MLNTPFALLKVIAKVLGNALGGGIAGDLLVEVLPEVAKDGWELWSQEKDEKARRAELQAIVQASHAQLLQQVQQIVSSELSSRPQVVQQTVEIYLTQLPAAIRRQMRNVEDPSGQTIPPQLPLQKADDLLRLLPAKLARFKPGDQPLVGVDWELEQLLGVGGFGEVWKAHNPHLSSVPPVALKFCLDPQAARSLRNEARLLDQVMRQGKQPGIVQLLHSYLRAEVPCLEYEFVAGGDLGGLILAWHRQQAGPTPAQAARVILRLAEIVAVAHAATPPIVHRDLKPSNILVTPAPGATDKTGDATHLQFKIVDFGIGGVAADQTVHESRSGLSRGKLLVSGMNGAYSPHYASPQQILGEAADPRDDIFALGVIWWQLLTCKLDQGRPSGRRWSQSLAARGMSEAWIDLLADCFEDEPMNRPANATVLVKELSKLLGGELLINLGAPNKIPPQPRSEFPHVASKAKWQEIGIEMVTIAAGEFWMGSDKAKDKAAYDDELPQHKLYLPSFKIARVPVTVAQFAQFVKATSYKTTAEQKGSAWDWAEKDGKWQWLESKWQWFEIKGAWWSAPRGAGSDVHSKQDHPVTCVSWYDAMKFCEWAEVRLPTEAEWEKAARGTSGRIYPWGNETPDRSRCNFNMHVRDTTPMGNYPKGATPEGLLDMAGNVRDWTSSLWGKDVNKSDFGYPYKTGDDRETLTAGDDVRRVVRGGSWHSGPGSVRIAYRFGDAPSSRLTSLGFRVVSPGS